MILFVDTETTGLPRFRNAPAWFVYNWPHAIQLGWVLTDEQGREVKSACRMIKPRRRKMSQAAFELHGISFDQASDLGDSIGNVLKEFASDIRQADAVVGHNIQFDEMVIRAEFWRKFRRNPFRKKALRCTMREATEYCGLTRKGHSEIRRPKWPSLIELHQKLFAEDIVDQHNALADTRACSRCFWELRKRGVLN